MLVVLKMIVHKTIKACDVLWQVERQMKQQENLRGMVIK